MYGKKSFLLIVLIMASFFAVVAQDDFKMVSSDDEFVFSVTRNKTVVNLKIEFKDLSQYSTVAVERRSFEQQNFTLCKYVEVNEEIAKANTIEADDKYPLPAITDCFYRLRLTFPDGGVRTYPAIHLPAVKL